MSVWRRLLGIGEKALEIRQAELDPVVLGYPHWPIFDSYGAMYRKQPAVRTVVDFLADNVAQLNPKIFMRLDDLNRREWNDHPLAELLRRPNPSTSRFAHLRDTMSDLAIYDIAFWQKLRQRGLIRGFLRLPPSRVQIEFDQTSMQTKFRIDGREIRREDLVIFHGYHPDGGDQGVSPLETLRRVLSEEWAATTHREWYWRNAARQSGVIQRPKDAPVWSDDAKVRFRQQWEATMAGGINAGRTAILEDGMTWNTSAFSPKDSEYIESRKLTYIEVARVYAPSLAGLLGEEGKTATESFHRQLYQDAIAPALEMIEGEIDLQLLGLDEFDMGPAYCEFNLADKLKGSFEEQNRALTTAVGVPYLTINEARTSQNKPRIEAEWADIPVQPLNVLYGGQPAVTVPTEDPGTAARDITAKLLAHFDHQEQSLVSMLGALKNQGQLTIDTVWDQDRWNRALAAVYVNRYTANDALKMAEEINLLIVTSLANRYPTEGLEAVREVFKWVRDNIDQFARPQLRQPALSA